MARQVFANFADQFTAEGDTRLSAANKNKKPLTRGFAITDAMMADFRAVARAAEGHGSTTPRSSRTRRSSGR